MDISQLKSVWKPREDQFTFYCPCCREPRKLPFYPRPGTRLHVFQWGVSAAFLTLCLWPWMEERGILLALPLWGIFEVIYRLRSRMVLSCPHCGFDPYLYLTDVRKAKTVIQEFWKEKLTNQEK